MWMADSDEANSQDWPDTPPPTLALTLGDRLREAVTRLAASPRLQAWAGRFPLTRPLARQQMRGLFDLCAGFVYSQVLYAFVTAGLLEALRAGPRRPEELTRHSGLPEPALRRLLQAAAALGLAAPRSRGRFGLGLRGAALAGNPGAVAMIRHHRLLYGDLADPLALLRGEAPPTQIGRYWTYVEGTGADAPAPDAVQAYSDLMAVSQAMIAEAVTRGFPFRRYRRILDVGGGTGTFLEHVAQTAPGAALTLFDLPPVATAAADRMAHKRLGDRLRCIGGDFTADSLPSGHDLITLVRVVYDHDDATVLTLLKACRAALDKGGSLLIAEPMSGRPAGERIADAYFSFYLLAMGPGEIRSPDAHGALLRQAGFGRITALPGPMPDLARLILARP